MTIEPHDLIAALGSADIGARVDAIAALSRQPDKIRPLLAASLTASESALGKVWTMLALCLVQDDHTNVASRAVVQCLKDAEAVVRRSAIETLGALNAAWAMPEIAARLTDHAQVDGAWFDDNSSPSQAARRVLQSFGSPEALALLDVHSD